MREEYDFSQSVANPYARKSHGQVTMKLDDDVIAYFKARGARTGTPTRGSSSSASNGATRSAIPS